jgi:hypothetical protein
MSTLFAPQSRIIYVSVEVFGPRGSNIFKCALDTAATHTVLPATSLRRLGYDLSQPVRRTRLRAATGIAPAPMIQVQAITALERIHTDFLVAAHDLPLGVEADGLLGLDFFRGFVLNIDFIRGRITLSARRWWQFWR